MEQNKFTSDLLWYQLIFYNELKFHSIGYMFPADIIALPAVLFDILILFSPLERKQIVIRIKMYDMTRWRKKKSLPKLKFISMITMAGFSMIDNKRAKAYAYYTPSPHIIIFKRLSEFSENKEKIKSYFYIKICWWELLLDICWTQYYAPLWSLLYFSFFLSFGDV